MDHQSTDKGMSQKDWEDAAFQHVVCNVPPPVPAFGDGAICPWCGWHHETVTFGANNCIDCGRCFYFGYPDWGEVIPHRPESFVPFPWHGWDRLLKTRPNAWPEFKPNERLRKVYEAQKEMIEEALGKGKPSAGEPIQ